MKPSGPQLEVLRGSLMRSQRLKKALRKTRPGMDRALRVIPGHVMPRLSRARWIPQDWIAESLFTKSSGEHRSPCERALAKKGGWPQTRVVAGGMVGLACLFIWSSNFPETAQGESVYLICPYENHALKLPCLGAQQIAMQGGSACILRRPQVAM